MRNISFILCFLLISINIRSQAKTNNEKVLFFENFDNTNNELDTATWRLCTYANHAWSQYFKNTNGFENIKIEDGYLVITATKDSTGYKNGGIRSKIGFPCNTRLEVKAKIKKIRGAFPAIWQVPFGKYVWPKEGEIDLMEWVQGTPERIYQTVHTFYLKETTGKTGKTNENPNMVLDPEEEHVYAVDRTNEKLTFYVDGVETWSYVNENLDKEQLQYPFCNRDFDIILNYSLGGTLNGELTWPGEIADEDLPGIMWVDWVRVTTLE